MQVDTAQSLFAVVEAVGIPLREMVGRAVEAVGASCGALVLWERGAEQPYVAACAGSQGSPEEFAAQVLPLASWPRPLALLSEAEARETTGVALSPQALPLISVPLGNGNGAVPRGALVVKLPYVARDEMLQRLRILTCMAEWAEALWENAFLKEEIERKEEQVRHLIGATLDAQEAERERICLEVHDGVTQTLASAFQYLQTLGSAIDEGAAARQLVLRASALLRRAIQESRELINSLQPAPLRDLGLVATLRQEVRELEEELKWRVDFRADGVGRLPKDVETSLYRIVREAVTNVKKHAGTDSIRVRLEQSEACIVLEVADWGRGFDPKLVDGKGTGLLSMRKRAELLQGSCSITSSPRSGTTVRVEIPMAGWRHE